MRRDRCLPHVLLALPLAALVPASAQDDPNPPTSEVGRLYAKRFADYDEKFAEAGAGDEEELARVAGMRALLYLADAQSPEGSWETGIEESASAPMLNSIGVSGLALLAFVHHGQTPADGAFKQTVSRAVEWLCASQNPDTGLLGEQVGHAYLYNHGIATLALAEVARAAPDANVVDSAVLQAAVDCVLRARNPYAAWRYDMPPVGDNDTSITGWMVLALAAAEEAGMSVDSAAFVGALNWFDEVTDPATGRVGCDARGSRSSRIPGVNDQFPTDRGEGLTAVALAGRQQIGDRDTAAPVMQRQTQLILRNLPEWDPEGLGTDMYFWYFGTLAMRGRGGSAWVSWRQALHEALLGRQRDDGSWPPVGPWGRVGGPVYSTALMAACLAPDDSAQAPAVADLLDTAESIAAESIAAAKSSVAVKKAPDAKQPEAEVETAPQVDSEGPIDPTDPLGLYGARFSAAQKSDRASDEGLAAIEQGLHWLAAHQSPEGNWDADGFMQLDPPNDRCSGPGDAMHDVGVTGLALLAFLGDGNTPRAGKYQDVVVRGLGWLRAQQDPDSGLFGQQVGHTFLYDHAIASLATAEAYYFTRSPLLRNVAQKATHYILRARNPYGAWRYDVPPVGDNDTSVTGWMVTALKVAEQAGLKVDRDAFVGSLNWIDEVTDPTNGRVGYDSVGSTSSRVSGVNDHFPPEKGEAMTGAGLFVRSLLGQTPTDQPIMTRHAELLLRKLPSWDPKAFACDMYYWYLGSNAMQAMGGKYARAWEAAMHYGVVGWQRTDGSHAGSWDPVGPWGYSGGRVYSTSMMVLAFEAPFRVPR